MKRLIALLLAVCMGLSLGACKKKTGVESTVPTTQPTVPTTAATKPPATTVPVTESDAKFRNPLTGEPMEEQLKNRPFAVMCNNIYAALPQHGISQADMLYEVLAEGGVTRCCAVFTDLTDVEKVGSLRSARPYYVTLSRAFDAIYVHAGGTEAALLDISYNDVDDIDALKDYSGSTFYRDQDRLDQGYSLEHTLFSSGPALIECAKYCDYDLERPEGIDYGLSFVKDATPAKGEKADEVIVSFRDGGKETKFTYNSKTHLYEGYQQGGDYIDGNTGKTVAFTNVMALYTVTFTNPDGKTLDINTCGKGEGYFASAGKIIPIHWSRSGADQPFEYTLEDGTPLNLGIGHTYVALLPEGSPVDYK